MAKKFVKPQWQIEEEQECDRIAKLFNIDSETARLLVAPPDEFYLVGFIKTYLLDPADKEFLNETELDVADMLNGRVSIGLCETVTQIFASWNAKLGKKYFAGR